MDLQEFLTGLNTTLQDVVAKAAVVEPKTEETSVAKSEDIQEVVKLRDQIAKQETTIAAMQATQTTITDGVAQILKALSPDEEGSLIQKMAAMEAEQNGQGEVLTTVVDNLGKLVAGSAVKKSADGQDGAMPKLDTVRKSEAKKSVFGSVFEAMERNPGKPVTIGA